MTVSVETVALLVAAGVDGTALVEVLRSIENDNAKPVRNANAERQRRFRAKRSGGVTQDVTRNVTDNAASLSLPPTPPNPNPNPPIVPPALAAARAIWAETPKVGRQRSGLKDLEKAVSAAVRRGSDPDQMLIACRAYYASQDAEYAKGVHRLIEQDRWREHLPDEPIITADDLAAATALWRQTGRWSRHLGPPPDQPGSRVKLEIAA
jgi:hypothetical protein